MSENPKKKQEFTPLVPRKIEKPSEKQIADLSDRAKKIYDGTAFSSANEPIPGAETTTDEVTGKVSIKQGAGTTRFSVTEIFKDEAGDWNVGWFESSTDPTADGFTGGVHHWTFVLNPNVPSHMDIKVPLADGMPSDAITKSYPDMKLDSDRFANVGRTLSELEKQANPVGSEQIRAAARAAGEAAMAQQAAPPQI